MTGKRQEHEMSFRGWVMSRALVLLGVTLLGAAVYYGCDRPSPTSPASQERMEVSISRDTIPADGESTVTITVIIVAPDGTTPSGSVVFATDLGAFEAPAAAFEGNSASATLTAGIISGTAHIRIDARGTYTAGEASVGSFHIERSTEVRFTKAGVGGIVLTATQNRIPADGLSTSTIHATVINENGDPAADGTVIHFDTTLGTIDESAETRLGLATAILHSVTDEGVARVTGSSGKYSGSTKVHFERITPTRLDLRTTRNEMPADGNSTAIITATVYDQFGTMVPDGTSVTFATTAGTIGSPVSTVAGVAVTTFKSPTYPTTAAITANSGLAFDTIKIKLTEVIITGFTMFVTLQSGTMCEGCVNDAIALVLRDGTRYDPDRCTRSPCPQQIGFTSTLGGIAAEDALAQICGSGDIGTENCTADEQVGTAAVSIGETVDPGVGTGQVCAVLEFTLTQVCTSLTVSGPTPTPAPATATPTPTIQATPTQTPGVPDAVLLETNRNLIFPTGSDLASLTATVQDANGKPVKDGTVVTLSIVSGPGNLSKGQDATSAGQIAFTFSSTVEGTSVIRATVGSLFDEVTIEVKQPTPTAIPTPTAAPTP
ncbi:MAG: hypothetical protein HYV63_00345 [Candidatus Schekmanbacteria bacterium]|nr:hypothetical protein [Candidatus Schekmanbacteria bacterium]